MIENCLEKQRGTVLLFGVTGSGKTEVYMKAAEEAVSLGKQVIVLVPEISLTPQTVGRFKSRFGDKVAILHSRLSIGERYDEWRRIGPMKLLLWWAPDQPYLLPLKAGINYNR